MSSKTATLALDDQLCFALYSASRAMTARYRSVLEGLGLTYPQYLVMLVLWGEGPVAVGRLGQRLSLDSGTLSPLLKRLEANGLITRNRCPDDERSVEVGLTPRGRRLRERAVRIPPQIHKAVGSIDREALLAELKILEINLRTI